MAEFKEKVQGQHTRWCGNCLQLHRSAQKTSTSTPHNLSYVCSAREAAALWIEASFNRKQAAGASIYLLAHLSPHVGCMHMHARVH
jgi:hypothetical protein